MHTASAWSAQLPAHLVLEGESSADSFFARDLERRCGVELRVVKLAGLSKSEEGMVRERMARAASLRHANIVAIDAWGLTRDTLWTVSARRAGVPLSLWIEREKQLPFLEAVLVLTQLADALAQAHRAGVRGEVNVASVAWCDRQVQWSGVCSPRAHAPQGLDASANMFQFGALAYEILTGRSPDLTSKLEPVNRLRLHLPPGLARVVMRCLDSNPAARWPSMQPIQDLLAGMVTPPQGYRVHQLVEQGRFLLRKRDQRLVESIERFEGALAIDPRSVPAAAGLGQATALFAASGESQSTARAREAVAQALHTDPGDSDARLAEGLLRLAEFDADAAQRPLELAVSGNPRHAEARAWLAWLIAAREASNPRALVLAREASQADPASAHAADMLGRIAFAAGDTAVGISSARIAIELDPTWPRLRSLGLALAATGSFDEACVLLERGLAISNRHAHLLGAWGSVHAARGDSDTARAVWDELLARPRVQPTQLAQLAAWMGRVDEARAWIQRAQAERDAAWWFLQLRHSRADWPAQELR